MGVARGLKMILGLKEETEQRNLAVGLAKQQAIAIAQTNQSLLNMAQAQDQFLSAASNNLTNQHYLAMQKAQMEHMLQAQKMAQEQWRREQAWAAIQDQAIILRGELVQDLLDRLGEGR